MKMLLKHPLFLPLLRVANIRACTDHKIMFQHVFRLELISVRLNFFAPVKNEHTSVTLEPPSLCFLELTDLIIGRPR